MTVLLPGCQGRRRDRPPGPITAATLAAGERNRHAGAWICIGHIAVELPLILLLAAGLGTFLESKGIRAGIGLVGGPSLSVK